MRQLHVKVAERLDENHDVRPHSGPEHAVLTRRDARLDAVRRQWSGNATWYRTLAISGSHAESLQQTVGIDGRTLFPFVLCVLPDADHGVVATAAPLQTERVEACPLCGSSSTKAWRTNA